MHDLKHTYEHRPRVAGVDFEDRLVLLGRKSHHGEWSRYLTVEPIRFLAALVILVPSCGIPRRSDCTKTH